ncbi:MAG: adenylyltransferase/cytidyltransferase family protein [Holosporales bacterium]|jgi:pantetheine-phosphate adenylyltransferase|nr:adenylyltransferase/cytidyltransferase family protein [Holosporales bacterium]
MTSQKALFAGTFNPFTIGHASVYAQACQIFGQGNVFIGVARNAQKQETDREHLRWVIHTVTPQVLVIPERTMVADLCQEKGFSFLVRSIRNAVDLVYEMEMCHWNRQFNIETLFIPCDAHLEKLSSSHVRELDFYGKNIREYLPPFVFERWKNRPKRVLITGFLGSGKSSFIDCYFKGRVPCFDFDSIAKEVLSEDIRQHLSQGIAAGSFAHHQETLCAAGEKLLTAFENLPEGAVVEASALGTYTENTQNPLNALYSTCYIMHIERFYAPKERHTEATFAAHAQAVQTSPRFIDIAINDTFQKDREIAHLCEEAIRLCKNPS